MRKLKLQMQTSVNGFVAGPNGELDWMTWDWDDRLKQCVDELTRPVDAILLGRKMTDGFVKHWTSVLDNPEDESYSFAKKMVDTPKIVFSRTLTESEWENTKLAKGSVVDEVNRIKYSEGGDIIVYGGAGFVTSLVKESLIDEYNFFVNPVAVPAGRTIHGALGRNQKLRLVKSTPFECGIVLNTYVPA